MGRSRIDCLELSLYDDVVVPVSPLLGVLRALSNARTPEETRRLPWPENIGLLEFRHFARFCTNSSNESPSEIVECRDSTVLKLICFKCPGLQEDWLSPRPRPGGGRGNSGVKLSRLLSSLGKPA